ncbi:hypothetical protein [Streptomyces rubiginosohelvolus]|uniref:hypothetical protein n=1 Tax=Streptomyces rubiginosohelvolus TaxID=67362 RepID=UPI0035D932A9
MDEIARGSANSSAVERGEVPQVAALGKELTELFNTLGITQAAYAVRTSVSTSLVSRCLNGKKLATQDFIDRLLREVEEHRCAPVRPEVREHLRRVRLDAVKIANPGGHQLEVLREELAHSRRRASRLAHREEALHLLIEQKENELQGCRAEIAEIRKDWAADQIDAARNESSWTEENHGLSRERDDLVTELAELKEDLLDALKLHEQAEERSRELAKRVLLLEQELANSRSSGHMSQVPVSALIDQLGAFLASAEYAEVARELVDAVATRSMSDVWELLKWLTIRGDFSRADRVVVEVVHARSAEEISALGALIYRNIRELPRRPARSGDPIEHVLASEVCQIREPGEIAFLHADWGTHLNAIPAPAKSGSYLLTALLRSPRPAHDIVQVISLIDPGDDVATGVLGTLIGRRYANQQVSVAAAFPGLIRMGRLDIVTLIWQNLLGQYSDRNELMEILELDERDLRLLASSALASVPADAMVHLIARMHEADRIRVQRSAGSGALAVVLDQIAIEGGVPEISACAAGLKRKWSNSVRAGRQSSEAGLVLKLLRELPRRG